MTPTRAFAAQRRHRTGDTLASKCSTHANVQQKDCGNNKKDKGAQDAIIS
jgi:hypothetical protein